MRGNLGISGADFDVVARSAPEAARSREIDPNKMAGIHFALIEKLVPNPAPPADGRCRHNLSH